MQVAIAAATAASAAIAPEYWWQNYERENETNFCPSFPS